MEPLKINKKQVFLGVIFLFAGTLEYLINRPIKSTYFLCNFESIQHFFHQIPSIYGSLGVYAPDFFHPLAFSLISMALFTSKKSRLIVCIAWFSIDSLFEIGQKYGSDLVEYSSEWYVTAPIIRDIISYFISGCFDLLDLMAIALGCLTAFFIGGALSNIKKGGGNEERI